jgi:starch phosphorylase
MGIPTAWVARVRESMARLTPRYSANRTVRQYTEQHYLPVLPPIVCASPIKAQSGGKWSIGSTAWRRNGAHCTSPN